MKNSKWMSVLQRHAPRYAQAAFKIASVGTITSAARPHGQIFICHLRRGELNMAADYIARSREQAGLKLIQGVYTQFQIIVLPCAGCACK